MDGTLVRRQCASAGIRSSVQWFGLPLLLSQHVRGDIVLLAALRDLQWRRKRFLVAVLGTALVLSMSLLMTGLSNSFTVEVDRTLDRQRASWWVTFASATGPFSWGSYLTPVDVERLTASDSGLKDPAPILYGTGTAETDPGEANNTIVNITVFGVIPGELGAPTSVAEGSLELKSGTIIVPRAVGKDVGESLRIGGFDFTVGGIVDKASLIGGTSTVIMTLEDVQRVLFAGQPLVSMILASDVADLEPTYRAFDRDEVFEDLMRPLQDPILSINFVNTLLWIVAAFIVAAIVYLNVMERARDFAIFKSAGVRTAAIGAGICLQAALIALFASGVAIVLGLLLAPYFPLTVVISTESMFILPILATSVGVLSGLVGVSFTSRVSPSSAFGGP